MNCPRCETVPLTERARDRVQIDVCLTCRGVWLDRGELDTLLAAGRADDEDDEDDDEDRDAAADARPGRRSNGTRGRRGKRGFFESLGDLFG